MSDFIKSIVEEVMKPYQKPKENPILGMDKQTQVQPPSIHSQPKGIQGVNRPNYQRANIQKRLAVISEKTVLARPNQPKQAKNEEQVSKTGSPTISKNFVEGTLSQLKTMSLVQGKQQVTGVTRGSYSPHKSELIGQTKDGIKAWLFSDIHPKLDESFHRSLKSNYVGVITSKCCTVGQLFILNETIRELDTNKYFVQWDKENKQSFIVELYDNTYEKVTQAIKALFKKLSQRSHKSIQRYNSISPSPWLTKRLGLHSPVQSVAVLDGVDYYSSIFLLDQYVKRSPSEFQFGYLIEENYLLLYGNENLIMNILDEIEKRADQFRK